MSNITKATEAAVQDLPSKRVQTEDPAFICPIWFTFQAVNSRAESDEHSDIKDKRRLCCCPGKLSQEKKTEKVSVLVVRQEAEKQAKY